MSTNTDYYNYESDHPEPNLVDNDMSVQRLMAESKPANNDEDNQYPTTDTDMMFGMFANPDKLVSETRRKEHGPGMMSTIKEEDEYEEEELSERRTDHTTNEDDNLDQYMGNNTEHPNPFQPTAPSFSTQNLADEKKPDDFDPYAHLSPQQIKIMKLDMLRKLLELKQNGIKLSHNYSMADDLQMMQYEYELHRSIRSKQNGIQWISNAFLLSVSGIEMLNENYNPFKLKLKGWSQMMNTEIKSYYDIFGDLYEKYNQPGADAAPEIRLLLMVGGSALKFHMMSTFINKDMLSNKELTRELREQAVQDRISEQSREQQESLQQTMNQQHYMAAQNVEDLEMLKLKEAEALRMQREREISTKQSEIEKLQKDLEMLSQYSGNGSMPQMAPPVVPFSRQGQLKVGSEAYYQQMQYQQALQSRMSELTPQQRNDLIIQQQRKQHKDSMKQQEEIKQQELMQEHARTNETRKIKINNITVNNDDTSSSKSTHDTNENGTDTVSSSIVEELEATTSSQSGSRPKIRRRRIVKKKNGVSIKTK